MSYRYTQGRMNIVYGVCHYTFGVAHDLAFRGELAGIENIPEEGGFIVAANHASHLDPPLIGGQVPRILCAFARKTLWKPGIAQWWMDTVGCIPVDRDGASDIQAMKRVLKALGDGKGIILFPEGTRSPDGKLQTPKAGVGFMACRTGVPVVPARIFGSFEAFGRSGPIRFGTPCSVIFGYPIFPKDYDNPKDGKERYQRASERIMKRIAELKAPCVTII
jgi:1-acyl-sn-glycerol-3-phosphate acyltransferase